MNYKKFEELPCWQKARELCKIIYKIINEGKFQKDYKFREQLWSAAGSVMDNIAEGFDDGSRLEFIRFLGYAQRSCGEVQSQLYRAEDCGFIDHTMFEIGYHCAGECRQQIKAFRRYLRNYRKNPNSRIPEFLNS